MKELTNQELDEILKGINYGLYYAYFYVAYHKEIPRKEIIIEAREDIEQILGRITSDNASPSVLRLRKYGEILDLLKEIPVEDLMREESLTKELYYLTYNLWFKWTPNEDNGVMLARKYQLIAEKAKLEDRINSVDNGHNPSKRRLVEVTSKYIELLRM